MLKGPEDDGTVWRNIVQELLNPMLLRGVLTCKSLQALLPKIDHTILFLLRTALWFNNIKKSCFGAVDGIFL